MEKGRKKEIRIGTRKLANPFLAAPMAGVSDSAWRRLAREQGAALVYSEMISAKGLCYNDKGTERLLRFTPEEAPYAIQLFGSEPEFLAKAAEKLFWRGHALWDINMGCPVPKVVKNGEGSALMRDPARAASLVRAVKGTEERLAAETGRAPRPVTVKCRLGFREADPDAPAFFEAVQEAGADAVGVHGRSREQYYSGRSDREALARLRPRIRVPFLVSGDVFSAEDALELLRQTGADAVFIARGAMGDPWIFREALALWEGREKPAPPDNAERYAAIRRHLEMVIADKGETVALQEMRKHVGWYLKGMRGAAAVRGRLNQITEKEALLRALEEILLP